MGFREAIDEVGYSLWEAQDTYRHRRRQRQAKRSKKSPSAEPSSLSLLISDLTRPHTSFRDKLRIRQCAIPHRKAWKRYKQKAAQAERMWGPQSRMPTQPLQPKR